MAQPTHPGHKAGHKEETLHRLMHDLNNFLMILHIHCEQLPDELDRRSHALRRVAMMQDNIRQIKGITREITDPQQADDGLMTMSVTEFYDELQKSRDFFSLVLGDGADIVISRTGAATGQNDDVSEGRKPEHGLSQRQIFIHLNFFRRVIMQLLRNSAEASFRDADHYPASFAVGKTSRGMSHRGEVMRISLEIDDSSDLFLVLRVSDNGPGISEAVKTQMSRPGFSTKSGSNRGYGLPAAQALAEIWGGTVSYCDEPRSERSDIDNHLNEDGAQFAVSFPYAERNRQA